MTKTIVMNNKIQYKNVLDDCKKGNFEKALNYINVNLKGQLNNKLALIILFSCCNACVYNKDNISEECLLEILKRILPFLKELTEEELISYVQYMYHCIKFFISKGTLDIILQMEDMIFPAFLPSKLSKKIIDTYHSIAKMLHNIPAKSALENSNINNQLLFKISVITTKICVRFLDITTTVQLSSRCFTNLVFMKLSIEHQIEYYTEVLHLLNVNRTKLNQKEIVKLAVHFSSAIFFNILHTHDFEKGLEFLNIISISLNGLIKCMECTNLHQVLKFFLLFDLRDKHHELNKCEQSLKELDIAWKNFENKKYINQYLIKSLYTLKDYFLNENSKRWLVFPEDIQLLYFKYICELNSFSISTNTESDLCDSVYAGFNYARVILSLIEYQIKNGESSIQYHLTCIDLLTHFLKQIELLKQNNFDQWETTWNSTAIQMHNIGILLHKDKHPSAKHYFYLIIENFLKLESTNSTTILRYSALESTCTELIEINIENSKKCLGFVALAIFLCNKSRDLYMTKWITVKHKLRDKADAKENLQHLTLVSALELLPIVRLNTAEKISLLTLELEQYKKKWKSKVPIVSALKALQTISNNENIGNFIVKLFMDSDQPNHKDFCDIVGDVLRKYKCSQTISSKINLAMLYYIYYKSQNKIIISKNADDMERVASVVPLTREVTDLNDQCDIISSFDSLKLDVYIINLSNLELSLSTFSSLVPQLVEDIEHVTLPQLYNVLLEISFEFKLICFQRKAVQALEMALKIAQLCKDAASVVKVIGHIIQLNCTTNSQKLIKIADELIENQSFSQLDNLEVIIMYYVGKSRALLYDDYKESYKVFKKAGKLFEKVGEKSGGFAVIKTQLLLLNSQFSMLPCNIGADMHEKSFLIDAYSAAEIMFEEYKNTKLESPYKLSLLIEASQELIKIYHFLKCPREVRKYAKEVLPLTQGLVLPLHTVSYLMYLAHADLLLNYQDDCYVKVKDMAAILLSDTASFPTDGATACFKRHSPSSPSMAVASLQIPCSTHNNTCDCYYCSCYEYQILSLEQARLSALINVKEKNLHLAQECFQRALKLYDYYVKKYVTNGELVPDFLPSYGYILLNYSSHLWRSDRKPEALNMNNMLLSLLETKKLQNVHLYNEALVQKLGYLTSNIISEPVLELQDEMDRLQIVDEQELPKTPENKQSEVSVIVHRPEFVSPRLKNAKKYLPFTFSPKESVKQPTKIAIKTPAPKIQIYTEGSERKTKRKANLTVVQVPVVRPESTSTCSSVTDSALKNRTKLLTQKLKQTSKKNEQPSTSKIENDPQSIAGVTSNPPRKNLLKELSASTVERPCNLGKGAVRRSARNKN